MVVSNGPEPDVEEVILQALSHRGRRKILKILASAPGGTTYSSILGETGLSTGRLNYHLKELAGFIEKDDERMYRLTALGEKALGTLRFTTEDLSVEVEGYVSATRANRRSFIRKNLNRAFYFLSALFLTGSSMATYLLRTKPEMYWLLAIVWAFSLAFIYGMDRVRALRRQRGERSLPEFPGIENDGGFGGGDRHRCGHGQGGGRNPPGPFPGGSDEHIASLCFA
jgi:DNA-binding transcriptional ArsR family regulator